MPQAQSHAFAREAGSDALPGTTVVPAHTRLAPRHLAAAAAAGAAEVAVHRRPRIAVIATGAEVVPLGAPLALGQIHDVNGIALSSLAIEAGADVVLVELTPDEADRLRTEIGRKVLEADRMLAAQSPRTVTAGRGTVAIALLAVLLAGAGALYGWLGAPRLPDAPLTVRVAAADPAAVPGQVRERLEARVAAVGPSPRPTVRVRARADANA